LAEVDEEQLRRTRCNQADDDLGRDVLGGGVRGEPGGVEDGEQVRAQNAGVRARDGTCWCAPGTEKMVDVLDEVLHGGAGEVQVGMVSCCGLAAMDVVEHGNEREKKEGWKRVAAGRKAARGIGFGLGRSEFYTRGVVHGSRPIAWTAMCRSTDALPYREKETQEVGLTEIDGRGPKMIIGLSC
jgi:hypothetical protein